ncbi:MAG: hypothetical protein Q7R34_16450 [Dehalococcoidia bacterium]|nr:hypothetical protein [Dehalococcoidia bacterium]
MKRFLLPSLVLVLILLGACSVPATTPNSTSATTPTPVSPPPTTPTPIYTLNVSLAPQEGASVSPPGGVYEAGVQVTLTATPPSGFAFDYWDGDVTGNTSTINITMNSNKSITAHFKVSNIIVSGKRP